MAADRAARAGVVVPVRAFADGKSRLASSLAPNDRARLLEAMAERVVSACEPNPVLIVSNAPEVVRWARELGVVTIADPGGLDAAAAAGRSWFESRGMERIVIAHADLPLIESLEPVTHFGPDPVAAIVPCHREDGTPVLSLPAHHPFDFSYGHGSFARHVAEARRRDLRVVEIRDHPELRHDVDQASDLEILGDAAR